MAGDSRVSGSLSKGAARSRSTIRRPDCSRPLGAASVTILKLMTDPNVPAAVRLRAAECVFDRAIKGIELEDIEARVSELERAAEGKEPGHKR